jgi:aldose 1-epimerase
MNISKEPFGNTAEGTPVDLYTLVNDHGVEVKITNYGGIIVSLLVPDRQGEMADVVLGFETLTPYLDRHPFFGALVGRYANRIAGGKFSLNGLEYSLAQNNGPNHLHGGLKGFDKAVWQADPFSGEEKVGLNLTYLSPDGEEGYPGALTARVDYTLNNDQALKIDYYATTDQDTILNLTNHTYFNLAGTGDILDHVVMLNAGQFTPIDQTLIPTGELRDVKGTPMDFTQPVAIGARINQDDDQLRYAQGYDHNWVLNNPEGALGLAATVYEPTTGRVLEVYTTQPGVQFYTGNFLNGAFTGKGGTTYHQRTGFCLETQHFPNSPNQPDFPSVLLRPGQQYAQTTVFKFSTRQSS